MKTIDGPVTIETEGGNDRVVVSSDAGVLDALRALLTLDTGAGTDSVRLDDAAELDANTAIITPNTVTGLDMSAGTPAAFIQTLTVGTGTFVLHFIGLDGKQRVTAPIAANASAAAIEAAIAAVLNLDPAVVGLPRTDNVAVSRYGNVIELVFQGQYRTRGVAFAEGAVLASRSAGVDYYGVETLDLALGSGSDVLNVQGTSALTNVSLAGGDDRVYVSSRAAYGLADRPAYLAGDLNALAGTLNLDLGTGRHTLMISDEAATAGDTVRITKGTTADIAITGLAVGDITFTVAATGNLADGVTIWTGSGADTIFIDATHLRPGVRTVTALNTGLGNDVVTVDLDAGSDDMLVLDTQGGIDHVLGVSGGARRLGRRRRHHAWLRAAGSTTAARSAC